MHTGGGLPSKTIINIVDGMGRTIPLRELLPGQPARLAAPRAGEQIARRLQDLGFVPDTPLEVVRRAPLGDPVEIEIRGYRLCLRLALLAGLRVQLVERHS